MTLAAIKEIAPKKLPAIALSPDTDLRITLGEVFKSNGWSIDGVINAGQHETVELLSQSSTPPVLIIDVDNSLDPIGFLDEVSSVCDYGCEVIVIGDDNRIQTYHEIKALGVKDYLPKPVSLENLIEVTNRSIENKTEQKQSIEKATSIIVLGARGGVGATSIALEVAHSALPEKALKKPKAGKVAEVVRDTILLDLDTFFGCSALYLDVQPSHALVEALSSPERIDDLFLERSAIILNNGLHLMAAEDDPSQAIELDKDSFSTLHDKLTGSYKNVIVDFPRHLMPHFEGFADKVDHVVLVLEPNIASLRDAIRLNNWIETIDNAPGVHIVLNKTGQSKSSELSLKDIVQTLGKEPVSVVPFTPDSFAEAAEKGLSIQNLKSPKPLKNEFLKLHEGIFGIAEESRNPSLISRILGRKS